MVTILVKEIPTFRTYFPVLAIFPFWTDSSWFQYRHIILFDPTFFLHLDQVRKSFLKHLILHVDSLISSMVIPCMALPSSTVRFFFLILGFLIFDSFIYFSLNLFFFVILILWLYLHYMILWRCTSLTLNSLTMVYFIPYIL